MKKRPLYIYPVLMAVVAVWIGVGIAPLFDVRVQAQNPGPCSQITNTATSGFALTASVSGSSQPPCKWAAASAGTVTSVTGSSPIVSSGGATPAISCPTCGTGTVTSVATTSPLGGGTITGTGTLTCTTCTVTIASGTAAMGTGSISSAACATAVTVTATGTAATDAIIATPNGDPTSTTGYIPLTAGSLYIWAYPTSGNVNFRLCNNTSAPITPGALTINFRVVR